MLAIRNFDEVNAVSDTEFPMEVCDCCGDSSK
jgi:hypothetical protein